MTTSELDTLHALFAALKSGEPGAREQAIDLLIDLGRDNEAMLLRAGGPVVIWPPIGRADATWHGVEPIEAGNYNGWDFPYFVQHLLDESEPSYCNQTDDSGEWFLADALGMTVVFGTYGNYNSPGAADYTYATVYQTREEYESAVLLWEEREEYLETPDSDQWDGDADEFDS